MNSEFDTERRKQLFLGTADGEQYGYKRPVKVYGIFDLRTGAKVLACAGGPLPQSGSLLD